MNFALKSFWFILVSVVLTVVRNFDLEKKDRVELRKKQTQGMFKESVLNQKLEDSIKNRLDPKKYSDIEKFCLQAGLNLTVGEYYIVRLFSCIVLGLLVLLISKNLFLGILFFIVGFILPKEIMETKKLKRIEKLNQQIGPFLDMTIKRYEVSGNMKTALEKTYQEFEGEEPMYSELKKTLVEIEIGEPMENALYNLSTRTGNRYLSRFADYYEMSHKAGTKETKEELLRQAYIQFTENEEIERVLRKELSKTVMELRLTVVMIPVFLIYMIANFDGYTDMIKTTRIGKIVIAIAIGVFMFANWLIKKKILSPLDGDK